jgi:hypothetical protein
MLPVVVNDIINRHLLPLLSDVEFMNYLQETDVQTLQIQRKQACVSSDSIRDSYSAF